MNNNNNNNIPITIFSTPTPFWSMPQEVRYHMCRPMAAYVATMPDDVLHQYLRGERALVGTFDVLACCTARAKSATAQDHVALVGQVLTGYRRIFSFLIEEEKDNNNNTSSTPGGSNLYSEIFMRIALDLSLITGACPTNTFELNSKAFQLICEIMVVVVNNTATTATATAAARLPPAHTSRVLTKFSSVVPMLEREQDAAAAFGALLYCLAGCGSSADTDCWAKCVRTIRDAHLSLQKNHQSNATKTATTPPPASPSTSTISKSTTPQQQQQQQQQQLDDSQQQLLQKQMTKLHALAGVLIPRWHNACRAFANGLVESFKKLAANSDDDDDGPPVVVNIESASWCDTRLSSLSNSSSSSSSFLPPMKVTWLARSFALILSFFSPADQIFIGFVPVKLQQRNLRQQHHLAMRRKSTQPFPLPENTKNTSIINLDLNTARNNDFDVVDDLDQSIGDVNTNNNNGNDKNNYLDDDEEDDDMVIIMDNNNNNNNNNSSQQQQQQRCIAKQARQQQRLRFATAAAAVYKDVASILTKTQLDASTALLWLGNPVAKAVKLLIQYPPHLLFQQSTTATSTQQPQYSEATKKLATDAFDFSMTSLEVVTILGCRIEASSHTQTISDWSLLTEQAVINAQWCLQVFNTSSHTNFGTAMPNITALSNNNSNTNNNNNNKKSETRRTGGNSFFENSSSTANPKSTAVTTATSDANVVAGGKTAPTAKNEEEERAKWIQNQKLLAAAAAVIASRRRNSTNASSLTSLFAQATPPNLPAADQTTRFLLNFENISLDCKNMTTRNQIYLNVLLEFIPVILGSSFPTPSTNTNNNNNKDDDGGGFSLGATMSLAAFNLDDTMNFGSMSFSNLGAALAGNNTPSSHHHGHNSTTTTVSHANNNNNNNNNNNINTSIGAFAIYNIPDRTWSTIGHHLCVAAATNLWASWDVTFAQLAQHITMSVTSPALCRKAGIITGIAAAILHARCSHEEASTSPSSSSKSSGKVTMARHMTMITNAVLGEVREKMSLISQINTTSSSTTASNVTSTTNPGAASSSNNNNQQQQQQQSQQSTNNDMSNNNNYSTTTSTTSSTNPTAASSSTSNNINPSVNILRGIISVMHSIFLFPWDHLYFDGNDRHRTHLHQNNNNSESSSSYTAAAEREHANDKKAAQLLMNCVATLGSLADAVSSNINDQEMLHPRFGPRAPLNEHTFNLFFQQQKAFMEDPALFFATASMTTCNLNNVGLSGAGGATLPSSASASSSSSAISSSNNASSTSLLLLLYYWIMRLAGRVSALIVNLQEKQESAGTREKESTTVEYVFRKKRQCTEICARIANHAASLPLSKDTYQLRLAGLELYFQTMVGFRHFAQLPLNTIATANMRTNSNRITGYDYYPDESDVAAKAARMMVLSVGADRIISLIQLQQPAEEQDTNHNDDDESATIVVIVRSAFGRCAFKFNRVAPVWATLQHHQQAATADTTNNNNNMIYIADGDVNKNNNNNDHSELKTKLQQHLVSSSSSSSAKTTTVIPSPSSPSPTTSNLNGVGALSSFLLQSSNNNITTQDPLVNGMYGNDSALKTNENGENNASTTVLTSRQRKLLELKEQQRQEAAASSMTTSSSTTNGKNQEIITTADSVLHQLLFGRPPLPDLLTSASSSSQQQQHAPVKDTFPLLRVLAREFTQQAVSNGLSSLSNYNDQFSLVGGTSTENNNNSSSSSSANTASTGNNNNAGNASSSSTAAPNQNSATNNNNAASPASITASSAATTIVTPAAGWKLLAFNAALASRLKGLDRTLNALPDLHIAVFDDSLLEEDEFDGDGGHDDLGTRTTTAQILFNRFFDSLGSKPFSTPGENTKSNKKETTTAMAAQDSDFVEYKSERRGASLNFVKQHQHQHQLEQGKRPNTDDGRSYRMEIHFRAFAESSSSSSSSSTKINNNTSNSKNGKIYTRIFVVPLPHSDNYSVVVDGGDTARVPERTAFVLTPASCARTIHDICFLHVAEYISPVQLLMRREALRRVIEVSEPFRQAAPFDATSANIVCELLRYNHEIK